MSESLRFIICIILEHSGHSFSSKLLIVTVLAIANAFTDEGSNASRSSIATRSVAPVVITSSMIRIFDPLIVSIWLLLTEIELFAES